MKVWFIKQVHNKIQMNPKKKKKKTLTDCKENNKIQINKSIERAQDRQQETIIKWNLIYNKLQFEMTL